MMKDRTWYHEPVGELSAVRCARRHCQIYRKETCRGWRSRASGDMPPSGIGVGEYVGTVGGEERGLGELLEERRARDRRHF